MSTSSLPPPGIATETPAGVQGLPKVPVSDPQQLPHVTAPFSPAPSQDSDVSGAMSPSMCFSVGTSGGGTSPLPRGIRSACDFCHTKRIKCKRDEGAAKCQQCAQRGFICKFSPKEKTGPKPKTRMGSRSPSPEPRRSIKSPIPLPSSASPTHARNSSLPLPRPTHGHGGLPHSPMRRSIDLGITGGLSAKEGGVGGEMGRGGVSHNPAISRLGQGNSQGGTRRTPAEQQTLEVKFMECYTKTVATLLPFCDLDGLNRAMALRCASSNPATIPSSLEQAQLAAALSIGALMCNDHSSNLYHAAARTNLKALFDGPNAAAAGVLCMLAFYWQYKGEDEKKDIYLQHARIGLSQGGGPVPLPLQLVLEHLDYEKQARLRQDSVNLPPNLRALHVVSCLLSDMSILMDADRGKPQALTYCKQLSECTAQLEKGTGNELPLLLCHALHSFLLVMLGKGITAKTLLRRVPSLFSANLVIIKALPLSWDASLIASTLAFLLDMRIEYRSMFDAVDSVRNTSPATQWTCSLPKPDSSTSQYLVHVCKSSSNICHIISQVGMQTKCGVQSFYYEDLSFAPPPVLRGNSGTQQHDARPPPVVTQSSATVGSSSSSPIVYQQQHPGQFHISTTPRIAKTSPGDVDTSPECATGQSSENVSPIRDSAARAEAETLSSQLEQQLLGVNLNTEGALGRGDGVSDDVFDLGLNRDDVDVGGGGHRRVASNVSEQLFSMLDDAELMNVLDEWDADDAWVPENALLG